MTPQDISRYQDLFITVATDIGLKILAAIAFWVIGRWLIHLAVRLVRTSLEHQKVDPTVLRYLGSVITVTLNVLLVVGILGYFGIQTTTFAALIAAAGVAIGMWPGRGCCPTSPPAPFWSCCGRSRSAISSPLRASPAP